MFPFMQKEVPEIGGAKGTPKPMMEERKDRANPGLCIEQYREAAGIALVPRKLERRLRAPGCRGTHLGYTLGGT